MKLILDLDTGIDDALALAYALANKDIDLIGVTNVFGNVTVETANQNTLDLLNLFNRSDIPVFKGASHPLNGDFSMRPIKYRIHGNNGIGNVILPKSEKTISSVEASDFIVEAARQYKEELVIVAVAPLTNIANAIKKDYDALSQIRQIVIMGGALSVPGNVNKFAEANIYEDPKAADYVFKSGVRTTMVGLDVTHRTLIRGKDIDKWNKNNPRAKALFEMATYYYKNEFAHADGGAMHDPLAVDVALHSEVITQSLMANIAVICDDDNRGRTINNLHSDGDYTCKVCLDVDKEKFIDRFLEKINETIKD